MTGERLEWSVPPAAPARRAVIFAVALVAAAFGWLLVRQPLIALLGPLLILGATADHWLGTRFVLDEKGASSRTGLSVTAMEWSAVRRVLERGAEIRLSPLENSGGLDAFRGVGLVPTEANRPEVQAFIESHSPAKGEE